MALASQLANVPQNAPFCHNSEGWGPLSTLRFDFTPCFLEVPGMLVAVFGIFAGSLNIWYLLAHTTKQPIRKNLFYYLKLVFVAAIALLTTVESYLQVLGHPDSWFADFRTWAAIIQIAALGTVFAIHQLEHDRTRVPSGVVLFYWLFYIVASIIKARSFYVQDLVTRHNLFALACLNLALSIFVFFLQLFAPKRQSMYSRIGDEKEYPSEVANIFSLLSFGWLTPLMKYGYRTCLTEDDLWNLPARHTAQINGGKLLDSWYVELQKKSPGLWRALLRGYGNMYFAYVPLKLVAEMLNYVQPQLLRLLIQFVASYQTDTPDTPLRGFVIAGSMLGVSLCQSTANNQFMNFVFELSQVVKAGLQAVIYKKSLRLSNEGRAAKSTGDIVNLMTVDTQRISEVSRQGFQLWSSPFQITLCMLSLYQLLGWTGFAGLAVMAIMIPLNTVIARLMKRFQKKQMKNKDERTSVTTEILNNIKSIKLYAWTEAFAAKLAHVRNDKELKTLRQIGGTQAVSRFCWNTTPFFVSCATFSLFVMINKQPLTVDLVFPALTLFNLLTNPLQQLPNVITAVVESTVAANRIKSFLLADEVQSDAVERLPRAKKRGEESIRISSASFTYGLAGSNAVLSRVDFVAAKGELNCIVGRVGSGKSSLLRAILGDLHKLKGSVTVRGNIAYVAQHAWIMNASVKDNILFGKRFDPRFYNQVIHACALVEDLAILPDGDRTEVGEKGISLSGGQKARLQLARAVYAQADVYLLDDILSAVDQHVGRHIINNVVGPRGLLRTKTRILATNSIPVLETANHITLVTNGRITEAGSYWDVLAQDGEIASLIKTLKTSMPKTDDSGSSSSVSSPTQMSMPLTSDDESDDDILAEFSEADDDFEDEKKTVSVTNFEKAGMTEMHEIKPQSNKTDEESGVKLKSRQTKEISAKGKVKWSIYMAYAKACNAKAVGIWFFTIIAAQSLQVSGSVWLKNWAELNERTGANPDVAKNVAVYFALGISASAMVVVQTMIMWLFCTIQASKLLHERMAHAMFRSPMSFFETTPVGRILNRFSADMNRVDEAIGRSFSEFFGNLAKTSFTLGLICAGSPAFILVIIPLGVLYLFIQRYYLHSNRELKRLESVSRSPIFAHFAESLGGVATIRAFNQEKQWAWQNEHRIDNNLKAQMPSIHANRWLGIRLEYVGSLVIFSSSTLAILSVINGGGPSAGMVGLAMAYALQITQALNWMVRLSVEVETNIVSVERVLEYANLPSEAEDIIHGNRPTPTWPSKGAIQFNDFSMRYRPGLDLVLKNISMSIKAKEKIGVVGRTGAGKSSLTLSLFRMIEAAAGSIEIDDIDSSSIGLQDLRSKLAIIPQDAALFEGTIRDNLDPFNSKSDEQLWDALEHARLARHVGSMTGGLDAAVHEGGSNLSQGQKQLVSLARALLTRSSILVLDEATAAVDVETDALLQETLRSDLFNDRTIITIAHRINTIIDCDRILVLQRGEVVEFDTPEALIRRGGMFFDLAKEAGLVDGSGRR